MTHGEGSAAPSATYDVGDELPLSVIVPVRDNAAGIRRCVEAIVRQAPSVEIIVVDDASRDDTALAAAAAGAHVLSFARRRGAAAARNAGATVARGQILLFTDADCTPNADWTSSLSLPVATGAFVAAKGVYRSSQRSVTARFVQLEYEERYARMAAAPEVDFLDTYSMAVRRRDLLAIGGFDEAFAGASVEDQEMSFRLRSRGRFAFVPGAVVEHVHSATPKSYLRKKLRIGRGKATLLRRHPARIVGDSHTPDSLRYQIGIVALCFLSTPLFLLFPAISWFALAAAVAPIGFSLPLLKSSFQRHGVWFALAACGLVLLRAFGLGAGFIAGIACPSAKLQKCSPPGIVDAHALPSPSAALPAAQPLAAPEPSTALASGARAPAEDAKAVHASG